MKSFILFMLLPLGLFAQDTWVDYIIGRPLPGYTQARKAVALEWGLNYQPILAGDVVNDDMYINVEKYKKSNADYLQKIENQYGKNWLELFNLETSIQRLQSYNPLQGKWIEFIPEIAADKSYISAKQEQLKAWGIPYQGIILTADATLSSEQEKAVSESSDYLRKLTSILGENWQEYLDRQLQIKLQQKTTTLDQWNEYLLEEVDETYYLAKKEVLQSWGISYEPHFVHCCKNKEKKMKAGNYAAKAATAKTKIQQLYGKGWEDQLRVEIQKKLD
jgi:hypothetical protein